MKLLFRSMLLPVLCILVVSLPRAVWSQNATGEAALSDESIQLRYVRPGNPANTQGQPAELGVGLFWNENRDFVATAGYQVEASRLRFNRLSFLAGPIAYAAMLNTENTDIFSLALGVEARFEFLRRQGLDIVARAAYAPDILTFGSADNLVDIVVRAELPLTERIIGLAGYRLLEIDLLEGTSELEESLHLGLRYRF